MLFFVFCVFSVILKDVKFLHVGALALGVLKLDMHTTRIGLAFSIILWLLFWELSIVYRIVQPQASCSFHDDDTMEEEEEEY